MEPLLDLRECKRIVVKVGTSTLTYENGKLNLRRIEKLVRTLSDMKNFGRQVVLVTSGAVGAGVASCLFKKEWIKAGEWDRITEASKAFCAVCRG